MTQLKKFFELLEGLEWVEEERVESYPLTKFKLEADRNGKTIALELVTNATGPEWVDGFGETLTIHLSVDGMYKSFSSDSKQALIDLWHNVRDKAAQRKLHKITFSNSVSDEAIAAKLIGEL